MAMYAEERQDYITRVVQEQGRADAARLADELKVTGETMRRDLIALERRGLVRRTHGGVIAVERLGFEPNHPLRATVMVEQKARIARAALAELPIEGAILIDSGTTTAALAEILPSDRQLSVVTNSLDVLNQLSSKSNFTVMMLGGRMRPVSNCTVDEWAIRGLQDIRVDVAFMGTNGLTAEHGATTSDQAEASVKSAMIRCARKVVLLADHSKIGNEYFHLYSEISNFDLVISDTELDNDLAEDIRSNGPQVVLA